MREIIVGGTAHRMTYFVIETAIWRYIRDIRVDSPLPPFRYSNTDGAYRTGVLARVAGGVPYTPAALRGGLR